MKLSYDKDTGVFNRNGKVAGTVGKNGYRRISIGRKHRYYAHRLAWEFIYGEPPCGEVDHINGDRDDNRIDNLRVVTHQENAHNMGVTPKHNTSALIGVSYYKRDNTWSAYIKVNGRKKHLGYYPTPELAHAAYLEAKHELHPSHRRLRNVKP